MKLKKLGGETVSLKNTFATFALLIIAGFIGITGYCVYIGTAKINKHLNPFKQSSTETFNCARDLINKIGIQNGYCLTNSPENFNTLLIGDSNADHLFLGLATNPNLKIISLGQGGCAPLLNLSTHFSVEGEQHCQQTMLPALNFALKTPKITTVIISMAGQGMINSRRNLYGEKMQLHSTIGSNPDDINKIFQESLFETLRQLTTEKKKIIYILPIPRLDFHPQDCVDIRPVKFSIKKVSPLCAITKKLYEEDAGPYLDITLKVLSQFPEISIFNPANELCDNQYCYALKNGEILYRDELHLSAAGSKLMGKKIIQIFENID